MSRGRSDESPLRFCSISAQNRQERKTYYDLLELTQKGDLDITPWLEWFLACLDRAFDGAAATLGTVLRKAHFWETPGGEVFTDRQRKVQNRLLEGFEGKLTTSKWAALAKTSPDHALRDTTAPVGRGVRGREPG